MRDNRNRFAFLNKRTPKHAPIEQCFKKYNSSIYATNESMLGDALALPEKQKLDFYSSRSSFQSTGPSSKPSNSDF